MEIGFPCFDGSMYLFYDNDAGEGEGLMEAIMADTFTYYIEGGGRLAET